MDFEMQLVGSLKLGVFKKLHMVRIGNDIIIISSDLFRSRVIKRFESDRIDIGSMQKGLPHDMRDNILAYRPSAVQNGDTLHNMEYNVLQADEYMGGQEFFKKNLKRLKNITNHYYGGGQ